MPPAPYQPQQNRLLATLAPEERQRIYPQLRLVPMPLGKVLYASGGPMRCAYFRLLLSLDRLPAMVLSMTQELIANMLGVRREGVTEAAGKLQELGVISYSRGKIVVLDRAKLEGLCCEC